MQDYFISTFYSTKDASYIADIPDLRFCSAFGETPKDESSATMKACRGKMTQEEEPTAYQ